MSRLDESRTKSTRDDATLSTRVWAKVERRGPDECWPWTGCRRRGYGLVKVGGKRGVARSAHRVVYELTRGPIPPNAVVLHACDNPPCCNPRHLRIGDQHDNARDRELRGRTYVKHGRYRGDNKKEGKPQWVS